MKTRHRPKTKLSKLVEIVPDMYPDLLFCDLFCEPLKISEKVAGLFQGFIYNCKQRVAVGDGIKWHTLNQGLFCHDQVSSGKILDFFSICDAIYRCF